MRPVKSIVKRVMLVLGVLLILLAVVGFIGFRWGLTPLPKPPQGVRIEPLSPPRTAERLTPDNGAFHYMKAVAFIQDHPSSKKSKDQIDAFAAGVISVDTNVIGQTLKEIQPALDLVREGSRVPFCQMPLINIAQNTSFLGSLRQLARFLVADGKLAERKQDCSRAIDDYLTTVKFGTDCAKGGPIIYSLVGDAIVGIGTQGLRAWALQGTPSPEALRNAVETIGHINSQRIPLAETLRYELQYSEEELNGELFKQMRAGSTRRIVRSYFNAAFGELIQDAEKPFWESNSTAIIQKWQVHRSIWLTAINRPIPRILVALMLPIMQSTHGRTTRTDLEFEATPTVCALKSYEMAHGSPPNQLSDLVPDLLPAIPTDPFDGKPLRYRREGKDWVLWSVGSDLKDDNAAWHEYKYRKPARNGKVATFISSQPSPKTIWPTI